MSEFVSTEEILRENERKVLNGSKVPHISSMPVLRKVSGKWKLAFFLQLQNANQIREGILPRPSYWYIMDLADGSDFHQLSCDVIDFCHAPKNYTCKMGEAVRRGTREDVQKLYSLMDEIRTVYLATGVVNASVYRDYQTLLFEIVPSGQLNFYKELTKLA